MQRLNVDFRVIRRLALRYTLVWAADGVSIALTALLLPGIYFVRDVPFWFLHPFLVALLFGLLNALVRPVLILLLLPITFVTLGLATLLLNVGLFYSLAVLLHSFVIESFLAACVGLLVLTLVNTLLGNLIRIGDDYSFYATLIDKFSTLTRPQEASLHAQGLLIIQIDGLSHNMLRHAIKRDKMPFVGALLKQKRFVLRRWFSGLPSQTSAAQANIFYGNNHDIPGFRWYDKRLGKLVVSSNSADLRRIDERIGDTHPSILREGAGINTLLHGGASRKMLAVSTMSDRDLKQHRSELEDFAIFSLHPNLYMRTIFLMIWDFLVDRVQAALDAIQQKKPRIKRGIMSSVHRAFGNALFREITSFFVRENIVRGVPVIYANYIGYDMVAHYGGPSSWDALSTLTSMDRQFKRIFRTIARQSTKPFDVVILSDHGQTPSVPFDLEYGLSLHEFIEQKAEGRPVASGHTTEVPYISTLLRELRLAEEAYGTRPIRRGRRTLERLRTRIRDDVVERKGDGDIIVCATGNLAHVYFTERSERFTTEALVDAHPGLLEALVSHDGIGFLITTNNSGEYIVMGKNGIRKLVSGVVEGMDPLARYTAKQGPNVLAPALLQLARYPNSGDLILNGTLLDNGRVVTFENQRGTHGGIGGDQTEPFIIYPRRLRGRSDRVENPAGLHRFLKELLPRPRPTANGVAPSPEDTTASSSEEN